jgi:Zn-dependent membrane protease YugP
MNLIVERFRNTDRSVRNGIIGVLITSISSALLFITGLVTKDNCFLGIGTSWLVAAFAFANLTIERAHYLELKEQIKQTYISVEDTH